MGGIQQGPTEGQTITTFPHEQYSWQSIHTSYFLRTSNTSMPFATGWPLLDIDALWMVTIDGGPRIHGFDQYYDLVLQCTVVLAS